MEAPPAAWSWSQPRALRRRYELRAGHGSVGELRFGSLFSSSAKATLGPHTWEIRAEGRQPSQVLMTAAGARVPEVTFTRHGLRSGGMLDLSAEASLRVRLARWRRRVSFETLAGEQVLRLRYRGLLRSRGELEFGPRAEAYPRDLLAVIAWYLVVTGLVQLKSDWVAALDG